MIDDLTGLLISLGVVLGPIWLVMHYKYKNQRSGAMSGAEAAIVEQMNQTAQRLEQRVVTLERILDAEVPAWRNNFDAPGQYTQRAS